MIFCIPVRFCPSSPLPPFPTRGEGGVWMSWRLKRKMARRGFPNTPAGMSCAQQPRPLPPVGPASRAGTTRREGRSCPRRASCAASTGTTWTRCCAGQDRHRITLPWRAPVADEQCGVRLRRWAALRPNALTTVRTPNSNPTEPKQRRTEAVTTQRNRRGLR